MLLLSFENLAKIYYRADKSLVGIKNFNLSLNFNDFVCLVGPSGCGKSTIISLAAGYNFSDSGKVTYQGQEIQKQSPERAVIFQENAIFPWMTVKQNIGYGKKFKKLPKQKQVEIVDKYLHLLGLEDYADFYPKQLSGGMKKKVDIGRAYANNPQTLLMDEPFGSLDAFTRKKMQELLLNLWEKEKKTILFVTHDLEEAVFLGDFVVVMSSAPGKVLEKIQVPFSRPREHSIKKSQQFLDLIDRLEKMITI